MIKSKDVDRLTYGHVENAVGYIEDYWQTLTRMNTRGDDTLISLPHPYVVPSNGNDNFKFEEQYYWDSYFTAVGLYDEQLVSGMLDNLLEMYSRFGLIPNGSRYYLTSRSQPPILTSYIFHVYDKFGKSNSWLKKRINMAKSEYHNVWMGDSHPHHRKVFEGLSRYYDINFLHDLAEAESGWDMTPRFKRQCLDFLPIDLNCMLYKYEMDFARAAEIFEDTAESTKWQNLAEQRKIAVDKYMWSERKGFYFDYNYQEKKMGSVWSVAAYYALWSGIASENQAKKLNKNISRLTKKGGLTTTMSSDMYAALFGSAKTQWAYPNGWAPLHFIAINGLENYGFKIKARHIALLWLNNCNNWFNYHGEFLEKYNVISPDLKPVEGLYPSQTGFGWTNGVFIYLVDKYLKD